MFFVSALIGAAPRFQKPVPLSTFELFFLFFELSFAHVSTFSFRASLNFAGIV